MAPADPARFPPAARRKSWIRRGLLLAIALPTTSVAAGMILWLAWSLRHHRRPYPYRPHSGATIPIGMNLSSVAYWRTGEPFIDRFKTSGTWLARKADRTVVDVPLDPAGYPLAIPAGVDRIAVAVGIDPPREKPVDTYVLTYAGDASIRMFGADTLEARPGRILFKVSDPAAVSVKLIVSRISATDHLRDIHVVRTDQVGLFERGQVFNPPFVAFEARFAVLRFMDWAHTNEIPAVDWNRRARPDDASWSARDDGVPLEIMVRLANEAHTDMWYNVPAKADDIFVRNAVVYIRDTLAPGLRLHVEYANEMWNTRFKASRWARAQADALWGGAAGSCAPGVEGDDADRCARVKDGGHPGWMTYYGYRSAQVQRIAHDVFGQQADRRLIGVLSGFVASPTLTTTQVLQGIRLARAGTVRSLFRDYAVTSYFGMQTNRRTAGTILGWARSGPAGMDAALHEIEYGGALASDTSIAAMAANVARHRRIAADNGLRLVAYEGGLALDTARLPPGQQALLDTFYTRMARDPRMAGIYERMAGAFAAAGGAGIVHFADIGMHNKNGWWPVVDTLYETSSPRLDALARIAARARAVQAPR